MKTNTKATQTIAMALLLSSCAWSTEQENEELKQTWGQLIPYTGQEREGTGTPPPPTPTTPVTPTTWDGLQQTLMTSPYYITFTYHNPNGGTYIGPCGGILTVPLFVSRLQSIETAGTSKEKILDQQLAFIASTWTTWDMWTAQGYPNFSSCFYPRRYPLIYKFLVNRSQQTTKKGWLAWLGC